jgi:phosphotriesterase-related protein
MMLQTVLGRIPVKDFGFALPHEHILCDFIGADKTDRGRWKVDEVVAAIKPNLLQLKARGILGFVDCTPAYIGRDPRILKQLAQETGVHILTNTGYYGGAGDKFVPTHAYEETAEQLAARWIREWEEGIEDTGVTPGFIKIGVDELPADRPQLSEIDAKLIRAAAIASRKTGLSVTCHTGGGPAGYAAVRLFVAEKADPARFIVAHSDGHGHEINFKVAEAGAWVSYDGVGWRPMEEHLPIVLPMLKRRPDRLLLSMDSGWYWVGEPNGGNIRNYNVLTDRFLPALRQAGVTEAQIHKITVENPANAFEI